MPKMIESEEYIIQKINYVHANPVRRQYVKKPEDWMWSSANPDRISCCAILMEELIRVENS